MLQKLTWKPPIGNYNICAKQKILVMNEMKQYEIQPKLKGWVQKIFYSWPPIFVEEMFNQIMQTV
jgi:hypothetical protein